MTSIPAPFRILGRRTIATNALFKLHFDHLKMCEGGEVPAFLVVEPFHRTADGFSGVAILPLVGGRVVLQRVYRHAVSRWGWEVPRGCIDEGETALQAAQRELVEETGLFCELDALVPLGELMPEPGIINVRTRVYAATDCQECPERRTYELGSGEYQLFSLEEAAAMAGCAEFSCAVSIASFYLYRAAYPTGPSGIVA